MTKQYHIASFYIKLLDQLFQKKIKESGVIYVTSLALLWLVVVVVVVIVVVFTH